MKKIDFKTLIITCIFCLLPIILGVIYYDSLPDKVAIHFDINNNPDNYFLKPWFVFGMPVFMVLIQIFCLATVDLTDKHKEVNKKATRVFKWIIPFITVCLYVITLLFNLKYVVDIRAYVMLVLGMMFVVVGNYTPKTIGGVYSKHKFKDEGVQKRITKMVSYLFIIFGVLLIISILFEPIVSAIVMGFLILDMLIIMVYGYHEDKKAIKSKESKEN